jgi:hypothetical protein
MTLSAVVGPVGDPPRGLPLNYWVRLEAGQANLSPEAAWALAVLFEEMDAVELLEGAYAIDRTASPQFKAAIREEVERRRGEGRGYRSSGWERALAVAGAFSDQHDPQNRRSSDFAGQSAGLSVIGGRGKLATRRRVAA